MLRVLTMAPRAMEKPPVQIFVDRHHLLPPEPPGMDGRGCSHGLLPGRVR